MSGPVTQEQDGFQSMLEHVSGDKLSIISPMTTAKAGGRWYLPEHSAAMSFSI